MKFTGPSGMVSKRLKSNIFRPKDTAAANAESALKAARSEAYNRQVEAAALRRQVEALQGNIRSMQRNIARDGEVARQALLWKAEAEEGRRDDRAQDGRGRAQGTS
eukprot:921204-Pleurochrysis_carterae.AAC.1